MVNGPITTLPAFYTSPLPLPFEKYEPRKKERRHGSISPCRFACKQICPISLQVTLSPICLCLPPPSPFSYPSGHLILFVGHGLAGDHHLVLQAVHSLLRFTLFSHECRHHLKRKQQQPKQRTGRMCVFHSLHVDVCRWADWLGGFKTPVLALC